MMKKPKAQKQSFLVPRRTKQGVINEKDDEKTDEDIDIEE
jgi:hypothetical protein